MLRWYQIQQFQQGNHFACQATYTFHYQIKGFVIFCLYSFIWCSFCLCTSVTRASVTLAVFSREIVCFRNVYYLLDTFHRVKKLIILTLFVDHWFIILLKIFSPSPKLQIGFCLSHDYIWNWSILYWWCLSRFYNYRVYN